MKDLSGSKNPNWQGGSLNKVCSICGKSFDIIKARVKKAKNNYCSRECYWESKRKRVVRICIYCGGKYETKGKKYCSKECWHKDKNIGIKKIRCDNCGEFIIRSLNRLNKYKNHFCSDKCKHIHNSLMNSMENNSNWRGGKSFEKYPKLKD
jgi:hypothetical protein